MTLILKQSTASQIVTMGAFVDETDGATPETGLSIVNTDIRLKKNGAADVAKNSGGATHDISGHYDLTLDATDTDTVGRLRIIIKMSGALSVWQDFQVLEEAVYDALYASSAAGPLQSTTAGRTLDVSATGEAGADLVQMGGSVQSATDLKDFADVGYDPATNKVTGVLLTDTTTDVTNQVGADMTAISGSATAADNLEQSALGIVLGVVEGSPTTTNIPSDLTEVTVDHYKGRILTFITGAVAGQSTDITAYAADGAMTVTALTNAPASSDPFVIT